MRQLFSFILLCCLAPQVLASALLLELESDKAELGLPVTASLYGVSLDSRLSEIDLAVLRKDFGVVKKDDVNIIRDSRWPGQDVQQLQLLLYPRKQGTLVIPPLILDRLRTSEQAVHIGPGMVDTSPIEYDITVSATSAWERQQILVTVDITTADKFSSLHTDEIAVPGFEVVRIPASRSILPTGKRLLRTGWALFPLAAGQYKPELPPIKYQLNGVFKRFYYLPDMNIDVRALPPYIPPTIPVGKVTIKSAIKPGYLLTTNNTAYLDVQLAGQAVLPYGVPPVLRQLQSSADVHFLSTDSERMTAPDNLGIHATVNHQVPFKAVANGTLVMPVIQYHYFDPVSARLVSVQHELPGMFALSLFWQGTLLLLALLLTAFLVRTFYVYWQRRQDYRRQREQALPPEEGAQDNLRQRRLHGLGSP